MRRAGGALISLAALTAAATGAVGEIVKVSVSRDGGPVASGPASISGDGRFVAFTSRASLTTRDAGGVRQLYVRDVESGRTELVSATATGQPANGDVDEDPSRALHGLSLDGRYAAFSAVASNLVALDRNATGRDVFRKDLATGEIILVDRSASGEQATVGLLGQPSISGDGNRVALSSGAATNLLPEDTNADTSDVLVRNIRLATTTLASRSDAGAQSSGAATNPRLSADGRVVAFDADARSDSLTLTDTNGAPDVVVRDISAGVTRLVSIASDGGQPGSAGGSAISADGQQVVFTSDRAYDRGLDTNGLSDVYLARPFSPSPAAVLISRAAVGAAAGNGGSEAPSMSADGSRIAYATTATNIVPGDTNAATADVVVASAGGVVRESTRLDGTQLARGAGQAALAGNASRLAFSYGDGAPSAAFVPGDDDGGVDIFARVRVSADRTAPIVDLAPLGLTSATAQISGRASDPSGVISLTVNGRPAVLGLGGSFSVRVPRPVASIRVAASDGSGNTAERLIDVPEAVYSSPGGLSASTVTQLSIRRLGRSLRIRYVIDQPARVSIQLLRRVPATKGVKATWKPTIKRLPAAAAAGAHRIRLSIGTLRVGVYQVRVRAASLGIRQAARILVIPAKSPR